MKKKIFSAAFAAAITSSLVIIPTVVPVVTIASNAVAAPASGRTFTRIKEIARKICEIGGCFYIVEQVVEYFQTPSDTPASPNMCSGKGCSTIRTGGNAVKVGETRTIIRKVRIR
ncbi:hypothetical protein [Chamaesiphon sp.]|uniref:hypothetical protein n=1 Tax=Chamaesiphon sp. TaxID=2814140 RepID=UPI00359447AD